MNWKQSLRKGLPGLVLWSLLYLAWVAWLGSWWLLLGLGVIFDLCVTHKVNWVFWKGKRNGARRRSAVLEWFDALVFATVVVTLVNIFFFQAFKIPSSSMESTLYAGDRLFVSKLSYGPRLPQTPLTVPFTHNVLLGRESYSTAIQCKYRRLRGFRGVRRGDVVVFGFPNGDTVLSRRPADDYHAWVRAYGRERVIRELGPIVARPADKKDHYVKRCVAVAGDTLCVRAGKVWVNGVAEPDYPGRQFSYRVVTRGTRIASKTLEKWGVNVEEAHYDPSLPGYPALALTDAAAVEARRCTAVQEVSSNLEEPSAAGLGRHLFPFTGETGWTCDHFGPIWIPQKGVTVPLSVDNLPLYERIIRDYEGHTLRVAGDSVLVDGKVSRAYTFAQDYYFMMGDNRHNSLDSRYWGFVPEDHVVGTPALVWLSTVPGKKFPANVRWRRFFKTVF